MTTRSPEEQLKPTIDAWAEIVIKEFKSKAELLEIHEGDFINSLKTHIAWHAGGDLQKIEFVFKYYGKFVDMGVGRGVSLKDRNTILAAGATNRKPKKWFTATFNNELARLKHIISERLARNTQFFIIRNVDDNADKRVKEKLY